MMAIDDQALCMMALCMIDDQVLSVCIRCNAFQYSCAKVRVRTGYKVQVRTRTMSCETHIIIAATTTRLEKPKRVCRLL